LKEGAVNPSNKEGKARKAQETKKKEKIWKAEKGQQ